MLACYLLRQGRDSIRRVLGLRRSRPLYVYRQLQDSLHPPPLGIQRSLCTLTYRTHVIMNSSLDAFSRINFELTLVDDKVYQNSCFNKYSLYILYFCTALDDVYPNFY